MTGVGLGKIYKPILALQMPGFFTTWAKRLAALPEPQRAIVVDTGRIAVSALGARIRTEDDAAFARLKGKMTVITRSSDDQARWDATYKQTRARLAQGVFSADLVQKLEALAR